MNAQQILDNLQLLANTPKTNEKVEILKKQLTDPFYLEYIVATLNPYIRFYCRNLKEPDNSTFVDMEKLLSNISKAVGHELKSILKSFLHESDPVAREVLTRMIRKDLCCNVGGSLVNKAYGSKIIPSFDVAKAEEKKHLQGMKFPAYANLKIDGQRSVAMGSSSDEILILSSGGNEYKQTELILNELHSLAYRLEQYFGTDSITIDGEFLMEVDGKMVARTISNGVCNKMLNGSATDEQIKDMKFFIFDALPSATAIADGGYAMPLSSRVKALESVFNECKFDTLRLVEYVVVKSIEEALELNAGLIVDGFEGTIIKAMDSVYQTKRMKTWVKLKKEIEIDVEITGYSDHSKDPSMIGALHIASSDGLVRGSVGTGTWLTEDRRKQLKTDADNESLVGRILTVTVMEITECKGQKSFYLPRIVEERFEKSEADSYDKILAML